MRSVETGRLGTADGIKEARVSVIGPMLEGLMKFLTELIGIFLPKQGNGLPR